MKEAGGRASKQNKSCEVQELETEAEDCGWGFLEKLWGQFSPWEGVGREWDSWNLWTKVSFELGQSKEGGSYKTQENGGSEKQTFFHMSHIFARA